MSSLLNIFSQLTSLAKWLDYPSAMRKVGGSYPRLVYLFFQFFNSFSFWSMAKYLEYSIATQEVVGSNPRRVTYYFKFLINFSFRYPSEAGESI